MFLNILLNPGLYVSCVSYILKTSNDNNNPNGATVMQEKGSSFVRHLMNAVSIFFTV